MSITTKLKRDRNSLQIHSIPVEFTNEQKSSQLETLRKKNTIRVAVIGSKAYWVHDNTFYESDIVDGEIDNMRARPIDAHSLTTKQVHLLLSVLDRIA